MTDHTRFLTELVAAVGGVDNLLAVVAKAAGRKVKPKPQTIANWKTRGVAWHSRPALAAEAEKHNIKLPPRFLPS